MPPQDLEVHQKLLNIRCLVKDKEEEIESFIQFAKMAQEAGNTKLGGKILNQLRIELNESKDKLIAEERNQGSKSIFSIKEKNKKLTNNLAMVEIAIADAYYIQGTPGSQDYYQKASRFLENVIQYPQEIDPKLQSICHQKLGFWQYEYLESNK